MTCPLPLQFVRAGKKLFSILPDVSAGIIGHQLSMMYTIDIQADSHRSALKELSTTVGDSRKIIVVSGAGISSSSGIPVRGTFSSTKNHLCLNYLRTFAPHKAPSIASNNDIRVCFGQVAISSMPRSSIVVLLHSRSTR